jgi:hypothetical protein
MVLLREDDVANSVHVSLHYALNGKGGTLTGTQSRVLGGGPRARQCFAAVVKVRMEPLTR